MQILDFTPPSLPQSVFKIHATSQHKIFNQKNDLANTQT